MSESWKELDAIAAFFLVSTTPRRFSIIRLPTTQKLARWAGARLAVRPTRNGGSAESMMRFAALRAMRRPSTQVKPLDDTVSNVPSMTK